MFHQRHVHRNLHTNPDHAILCAFEKPLSKGLQNLNTEQLHIEQHIEEFDNIILILFFVNSKSISPPFITV